MAYGDHESITIATAAIGFTSGNYLDATASNSPAKHADKAFCTLETAQVRFRTDGSDPTTTVGHLLNPGESLELDNYDEIRKFKAIRTGTTSGVLKVSYDT